MHLLGYLFDPAHPAIVAEQARLRDERVARLAPDHGEDGRRRLPRGRRVGVRARARGHQRRAPAPGPGAGRGRGGRVGGRGVRHAAAQRQPLLRARRPTRPSSGRSRWCGRPGGVAVFAHPLARRRGRVVEPIRDRGPGDRRASAALEVDHPDHAPDDRALLRGLAAEPDLVTTGSSDYHGTNKIDPGRGRAHRPRRSSRRCSPGTSGVEALRDPELDPATVAIHDRRAARARLRAPPRAGARHPGPARLPGTTAPAATGSPTSTGPLPSGAAARAREHVGRGRAPGAAVALRPAARAAHPGRGGRAGGPALEQRGLPRRRAGPPSTACAPASWLADYADGRGAEATPSGWSSGCRWRRRRDRRGGPGRPDRPAGRRAGGRRLQDRSRRPPRTTPASPARWRCTRSACERTLRRRCVEVELHHLPSGARRGVAARPRRRWRRTSRRRSGRPRRWPSRPRTGGGRRPRRAVPRPARAPLRVLRRPAALPRGARRGTGERAVGAAEPVSESRATTGRGPAPGAAAGGLARPVRGARGRAGRARARAGRGATSWRCGRGHRAPGPATLLVHAATAVVAVVVAQVCADRTPGRARGAGRGRRDRAGRRRC